MVGGFQFNIIKMFTLKVIKHCDLNQTDLNEIIRIKSVAWPYPYDEQIKWINNNIAINDFHVLLLHNAIPVAYLNLVEKVIEVNDSATKVLGVGNVCSAESRRGYGSTLMIKLGEYFKGNQKIGFLFCKKELINFYKKFGWAKLKKLKYEDKNTFSMIYNFMLSKNDKVIYLDKLF